MRRVASLVPWLVLALAVALYLSVLPRAVVQRPQHEQLFALPPKVLRVMSFQFKEPAADVSFLNALVFLGGNKPQPSTNRYLPVQYDWIYTTLSNSATLDPHFADPYYLMNSALIWDNYKIAEVNDLISKGADARAWDSLLPFFAGFNYYYFLDDNDKSFTYLKEASKRSGGNAFLDSLASRVAYQASKTEFAIDYLKQQINQAEQEGKGDSVKPLARRLTVLQGIRQIEVAVDEFRQRYNKLPENVSELLSLKLLDAIPVEPNGGSYYLDPDGRVRSTKDLVESRGKGSAIDSGARR